MKSKKERTLSFFKKVSFSDEAQVDTEAEVTTETIEEKFHHHGMDDDEDEDAGQLFLNFKVDGVTSKPGSSVSHNSAAKNSAKRYIFEIH